MQFPFAFGGTIRPLPYAAWSLGVFFSQHIVVLALSGGRVRPSGLDWWFYLAPVRRLMTLGVPDLVLTLGFACTLIAAWVLAAQACRRAADANIVSSIAILAIVPIIQVAVILCLCCLPRRATSAASQSSGPGAAPDHTWAAAALGLVAGIGVDVAGRRCRRAG